MRRAALLAMTALAGCSLEPRYVRPLPATPPAWPTGPAYPAPREALPAVSYRDIFRDPALDALIEQALANSQDLRAALATVEQARGQYRVQRSLLFPSLDGNARVAISDANNGQTAGGGTVIPGLGGGGRGSSIRTVYNVNLGLSAFEIDLFGRVRSLSNAALQEYLATDAGARAARLTLVAEVASAYLTLAADRSLLLIAADTEASALKSTELTRARLAGGVAPRTDLRQAETVLNQARADRAALVSQVAQDRNALELLVGAPVADASLPKGIETVDGLLAELPAGLDSRILLRRPDVAQAEYRLRAANARIGAARANFFPTISLTALVGFASTALGSLFTSDGFTWNVQPVASLPIFDGGANAGNLTAAKAGRDLALAQYQRAIQVAFREVADALARRGTIDAQYRAQAGLEAAARDTLTLATASYRGGITPFLDTLDSQRTLYAARRGLIQARLVRADNLVTLYRVLGGDQLVDLPPNAAGQR